MKLPIVRTIEIDLSETPLPNSKIEISLYIANVTWVDNTSIFVCNKSEAQKRGFKKKKNAMSNHKTLFEENLEVQQQNQRSISK